MFSPLRALPQREVDGTNIEFDRLSLQVLYRDAEVFGDLGQQLVGSVQFPGCVKLLEALDRDGEDAAHVPQPGFHGDTVTCDVLERLEVMARSLDGLAAYTVGHIGDQLDIADPQSLRKLAGEHGGGGVSSSGHSLYYLLILVE